MSVDRAAYVGQRLRIEWATTLAGQRPAKDFYGSLNAKEQAQMLALFKRLAEHRRISNREQFKKVEGTSLWEFKRYQTRLLGDFRPGSRFVVALGLRKKKDKHSKSDLERAARILAEDDELRERDKR